MKKELFGRMQAFAYPDIASGYARKRRLRAIAFYAPGRLNGYNSYNGYIGYYRSGAGLSRAGLGDVFADLVEEVAEGGGVA